MVAKKTKPRVYSYIRFSRPEQALGDSERRQLESAQAFASKHGLQLDTSLRMTDRGLSGYHGTHKKKGALGEFLKAVEAGEVPPGSVLVVENVDRLGREDFLTAFGTISTLIGAGITIQTLMPMVTYDRKSLTGGLVYQLVGQIQLAHEESEKKSERLLEARATARSKAREFGTIVTAQCPWWLEVKGVNGSRTFKVIPAAKKAINRIFDLKLKGQSPRAIEKTLNESSEWAPPPRTNADREAGNAGEGWRVSYIRKVLSNRAVIGEYQPHTLRDRKRVPEGEPIEGYYPAIVAADKFFRAQEALASNRGKGGQTGKASNIFKHLVRCAYCGGTMHFESKGKPPKGGRYLYCERQKRKAGCEGPPRRIRYDEFQDTLLANCQGLSADAVIPSDGELAESCNLLRESIAGYEGELKDVEQRIENLVDQIANTANSGMRERYEAKAGTLEDRKAELAGLIDADTRALTTAEATRRSFTEWQVGLKSLAAASQKSVEVRLQLNTHLRDLIDYIQVFSHGHAKPWDRKLGDGDDFEPWIEAIADEQLPELRRDKQFWEFVADIAERRKTKEGRFYRVQFKTGRCVDIAPDGSIATVQAFSVKKNGTKGWRWGSPSIQSLWEGWCDA